MTVPNKEHGIDIRTLFDEDVWTDWEGLTGREDMENHISWIKEIVHLHNPYEGEDLNIMPAVADLTLHWVHANLDQAGYSPTQREVDDIFWAIHMVVTGGTFSKSDIDWKE